MSDRLVLDLHRYGRLVFGSVLEQPEDVRGCGVILELGNWALSSRCCPQLRQKELIIRGRGNTDDDLPFLSAYSTESNAIAAYDSIKALVGKFNEGRGMKEPTELAFKVGDEVLVYGLFDILGGHLVSWNGKEGTVDSLVSDKNMVRINVDELRCCAYPQQLRHVPKPAHKPLPIVSEIVG